MGPPGRNERVMLAVFSTVLLLWLSAEWHGASPTAIAYLGLALLLVTRVLDWQDVLAEKGAWDALIWFGGLVMLAGQLDKAGLPKAFAGAAAGLVGGWPWWWALAALMVVYLYSHYVFASLVAHVTAMFPAFFAVAVGLGAPPLLTALGFGFFSSLNAAITHYGTGPAPIVFGAGYLTQGEWWRIGFVISLVHLGIWLPIGFLWWSWNHPPPGENGIGSRIPRCTSEMANRIRHHSPCVRYTCAKHDGRRPRAVVRDGGVEAREGPRAPSAAAARRGRPRRRKTRGTSP